MVEPLKVGTKIIGEGEEGGRYEYCITEFVANGGFSIVYMAERKDGIKVCLKEYLPIKKECYRDKTGYIKSYNEGNDLMASIYPFCRRELLNGQKCRENGRINMICLNSIIKCTNIVLSDDTADQTSANIVSGYFGEMDALVSSRYYHTRGLFNKIKYEYDNCDKKKVKDLLGNCLNNKRNSFSIFFVIDLVKKYLLKLADLHLDDWIFGDIHDGNILFSDIDKENMCPDQIVFIDFATAGEITNGNKGVRIEEGVLTTKGYIPPEILKSRERAEWTKQCDVYGVGCWMLYLLSGQFLEGEIVHEISDNRYFLKNLIRNMYDSKELEDDFLNSIIDIILKATNDSPDERFNDSNEFYTALFEMKDVIEKKILVLVKQTDIKQDSKIIGSINDKTAVLIKDKLFKAMANNVYMTGDLTEIYEEYRQCRDICISNNGAGYIEILTCLYHFETFRKFDICVEILDSLIDFFNGVKDYRSVFECIYRLIRVYELSGNKEKELENSIIALEVIKKCTYESEEEYNSELIKLYCGIIEIYYSMRKKAEVEEYILLARKIVDNCPQQIVNEDLYSAIGFYYKEYAFYLSMLGEDTKKVSYYFEKSLKMAELNPGLYVERVCGFCSYLVEKAKEYDLCKYYYKKAIKICIEQPKKIEPYKDLTVFKLHIYYFIANFAEKSYNTAIVIYEKFIDPMMIKISRYLDSIAVVVKLVFVYCNLAYIYVYMDNTIKAMEFIDKSIVYIKKLPEKHPAKYAAINNIQYLKSIIDEKKIKEKNNKEELVIRDNVVVNPNIVRRKKDFSDIIMKWIRVYSGENGPEIVGNEVVGKKIENALKEYDDKSLNKDEVFAILDISLLKNGKAGCLFTKKRLYSNLLYVCSIDELDNTTLKMSKKYDLNYIDYRNIKEVCEYKGFVVIDTGNNKIAINNKKMTPSMIYILSKTIDEMKSL